jgi:hypothetical protein
MTEPDTLDSFTREALSLLPAADPQAASDADLQLLCVIERGVSRRAAELIERSLRLSVAVIEDGADLEAALAARRSIAARYDECEQAREQLEPFMAEAAARGISLDALTDEGTPDTTPQKEETIT